MEELKRVNGEVCDRRINGSIDTTRQLCAYFNIRFFFYKYVYTTVLSFDIVAVVDEINFNSIQFNSIQDRTRRSSDMFTMLDIPLARPTLCCDVDTLVEKKAHENMLYVADMRILSRMCGPIMKCQIIIWR